jgi:hypothetical protein
MKRRIPFSGRLLRALGALGLLIAVAAAPALATSATGSQNPEVTVYVALTPDIATPGTMVMQTASVTNNTRATLVVVLISRFVSPKGSASAEPLAVALRPGESLIQTVTYPITDEDPAGQYELNLAATAARGTSRAKAGFTVSPAR